MMRCGLLLTLLIVGTLLVAARQTAPTTDFEPVTALVQQLLPIEEEIEARRWDAARETSRELADQIEKLPVALSTATKSDLATIKDRMQNLRAELAHADPAASYEAYFALRQGLFDLLNDLGYPSAPTLLLAHHDLEVARCAVRMGHEDKEITHELNELEFNYRSALPVLVEKGVSQQQTADVLVKISQARDALQAGEKQALDDRLAELEVLLKQQQGGPVGD